MATDHTKIQWTDATWNVVRGCSIVSPGCTNCYAMKMAHRFSGPGQPYEGLTRLASHGPIWTGKVRLVPEALDQPLRWKRPRRIFVNSMSDLFHEDIPFEFIYEVFDRMRLLPRHTFQILTKRPERALEFSRKYSIPVAGHIWLGVSCENQETADERIPLLLQTPAAVRFVSLEPLLGPIEIETWLNMVKPPGSDLWRPPLPEYGVSAERSIHWVIVGGESGPHARPCNIEWVRSIVRQCKAAGVACFVKQGGSRNRCEHDSKGGHFECFPSDLQIREFPDARS